MNTVDHIKNIQESPFFKRLGMETLEISQGHAKIKLPLEERHQNPIGSVHGGVLYFVMETAAEMAAKTYGTDGRIITGSINYLRPAWKTSSIYGEAVEVKKGKRSAIYDVYLTGDEGQVFTRSTMTVYFDNR